MARTLRDATLETRTARSRLKARAKPYYRTLEPGLHLGYRKSLSGAGKWLCRHYVGKQSYQLETLAVADDFSDADGVAVLSYREAQAAARERMVARAHAAAGKTGPLTVADAMDEYLDFLETERKSARNARYDDRAHIRPALGDVEVTALTPDRLRRWLRGLARTAARARTPKGEPQRHHHPAEDDDARRSSANRTLAILKAALNRVWRDGKVPSDSAWRRVEPFENAASARVRYLSIPEATRLINACAPEFRPLVEAALQTGCRYGELANLKVADFNPDSGTIAVLMSRTGKPRHVVLTEEGTEFFGQVCVGRAGSELMFHKSDGRPWLKSNQCAPMAKACKVARIDPAIGIHQLRHTWASLSVMNDVPLLVVAKNLGHTSTTMVERHYGHLAPSYVVDAIRAGAPRFGIRTSNVRPLR
jgi:integrase